MSTILSLAPQNVWKHFYGLTRVPRPSGFLAPVQQFLLDFAKSAGVEAVKDEAGNIIMRKPATPGMEDCKGVILQAHMDMVPQKNNDTVHDFEKDPIETYIDGEWVKARGTTLGSDNGMGVAAIMAVMEDKTLKHGPLEALITADEETGMFGAFGLKPGSLKGEILLNLDSEDEGELYIGCAGGVDVTATLQYKEAEVDPEDVAIKLTLKGLRGGHSGLEINQGRANANKLLVRFVREAIAEYEARLASWKGGNMRNAIPREADAVLTLPAENVDELLELVKEKDYFVLTTNVDHQFQKAGFERKRLFYTQGDYGLWQCSRPCHQKTYDNEAAVRQMLSEQKDMKIPSELIPRCPVCGAPMTMNLRCDGSFVEDDGWQEAAKRYEDFVQRQEGRHILYLELGVGANTPAIIKYPFWRMTQQNPKAVYACVNLGEAWAPGEIGERSVCIDGDIGEVLNELK